MRSGRQQPDPPIRPDRQSMDIEIGVHVVGGLHDWGGRRHDRKPRAFTDPVDVPVAMHQVRPARQGLQAADEPVAVDERRADALGERLGRPGILDDMVADADRSAPF